jgi:bifunctional non-homologous end joining protein LigD
MEQITLYYRQGSSDKVYQASIEPSGHKYVVNFSFGRRGSTLQSGTKTPAAVDYGAAKAIYEKLVNEKIAKGYTPGENGTPYQHTDKEAQVSGIQCQLLNAIEECGVARLVNNPAFAMQEKFDGKRTLIRQTAAGTEGINRKGLIVSLPIPLADEVRSLPETFVLDGECISEQFIAFDLLLLNGNDLRQRPFGDRYQALAHLVGRRALNHIKLAETQFDTKSKAAMLERLKTENKEGVVFKRVDAPYVPGRPATGGDQLKRKFYESASFIVGKVNGKRSVSLLLLHGRSLVTAGNVTIPANQQMPAVGAVVEVRYLYAFKQSGCVYQPVYLGMREDITAADCTVSQLKFKAD